VVAVICLMSGLHSIMQLAAAILYDPGRRTVLASRASAAIVPLFHPSLQLLRQRPGAHLAYLAHWAAPRRRFAANFFFDAMQSADAGQGRHFRRSRPFTIQVTMRYAHLAPVHQSEAVQRP
jgi:hypothetical protein